MAASTVKPAAATNTARSRGIAYDETARAAAVTQLGKHVSRSPGAFFVCDVGKVCLQQLIGSSSRTSDLPEIYCTLLSIAQDANLSKLAEIVNETSEGAALQAFTTTNVRDSFAIDVTADTLAVVESISTYVDFGELEAAQNDDEGLRTYRKFFNYLLLVVTIGAVNRSAYYYTELLSLLFLQTPFSIGNNTRIVTFDGVTTMRHFWGFLENPMIEGLYRSSIITTTKAEIAGQDRKVLNENKVLGVPRLRQLRVRNDSCEVPAIFTRTFSTCYDAYSSAAEEKEPFGPRNTTAWRYTSSEELDGISYMGTISNYHGGGYYQDLSIVPNETVNIVASLKKNLWINRSTRAVFLDFTVYNANINLFCVIKLLFEFPPTGGVLSSHDFTTMKLIRYVEPLDYAVMGFEFLFIFFVLFFTMEEVIEMMFFKLQYLFHFWNYIDLVILLLKSSE
ncbi:polycystin-2-like [Schistocerca americana]|uniref:polycystin-2-like n=1 Tax=Schistocerca americana TaxID=7009 RepID=UPI001F5007EE|nr:polycystin-2-like [Schistocerca americana]